MSDPYTYGRGLQSVLRQAVGSGHRVQGPTVDENRPDHTAHKILEGLGLLYPVHERGYGFSTWRPTAAGLAAAEKMRP